MDINTGIPAEKREKVAEGLKRVLADTYTLYLKTHNYHWNVTGPMFNTLHVMFEEQYNELWMAVDEVAERIRALGVAAPGDYATFSSLTSVDTGDEGVPVAETMIANLVKAHETVVRTAREVAEVASDAGDDVTEDMLIGRMNIGEKTAWMLRSLLG